MEKQQAASIKVQVAATEAGRAEAGLGRWAEGHVAPSAPGACVHRAPWLTACIAAFHTALCLTLPSRCSGSSAWLTTAGTGSLSAHRPVCRTLPGSQGSGSSISMQPTCTGHCRVQVGYLAACSSTAVADYSLPATLRTQCHRAGLTPRPCVLLRACSVCQPARRHHPAAARYTPDVLCCA